MVGSVDYNLFYEDKSERLTFDPLIRAYSRAITGNLISFKYDSKTYDFSMKFVNNSQIGPYKEILLPQRRYPNGWDLTVTGVKDYTYEWDVALNILKLHVNDYGKVLTVNIVAK